MLPSFEAAYGVFGPVQKVVAAACGVTNHTFYKWATGRARCPKKKRQSVDRAFGCETNTAARVDWVQYDIEFDRIAALVSENKSGSNGWGAGMHALNGLADPETPPVAQTKPPKPPTPPKGDNDQGWGFSV